MTSFAQTTSFRSWGETTPMRSTMLLTTMMVLAGIVGCLFAITTPWLLSFLMTKIGLVVAMILINVIPVITMWTHKNTTGVTARALLAVDGFISGIALGPLVWYAETVMTGLATLSLGITAASFSAIAALVFVFGNRLDMKKMTGICIALSALALTSWVIALFVPALNPFLLFVIGLLAVWQIIVGVEQVKRGHYDEVEGACILFAAFFNLFVVITQFLISILGNSDD